MDGGRRCRRRKEIAYVPTRVRAVVWGEERRRKKQILVNAATKCVRGGGKRYQRRRGMQAASRAGRRQGPRLDTANHLPNTTQVKSQCLSGCHLWRNPIAYHDRERWLVRSNGTGWLGRVWLHAIPATSITPTIAKERLGGSSFLVVIALAGREIRSSFRADTKHSRLG